jgi:hypothetical protein
VVLIFSSSRPLIFCFSWYSDEWFQESSEHFLYVLVSFPTSYRNTWDKELTKGKSLFWFLVSEFSAHAYLASIALDQWWHSTSQGEPMLEETCSSHGSQEVARGKVRTGVTISLSRSRFQLPNFLPLCPIS